MTSKKICFWLIFMIITQAAEENTRSMIMSLLTNSKFQCANATCSPFISIIATNILNCRIACLAQNQCKAATFYRSTANCELFDNNISYQNGNMLTDADTTSMSVITGTRFPSG